MPALAADHPADPQQVAAVPLLQRDHLVELLDHLARRPLTAGQADVEAAATHLRQRLRQLDQEEPRPRRSVLAAAHQRRRGRLGVGENHRVCVPCRRHDRLPLRA